MTGVDTRVGLLHPDSVEEADSTKMQDSVTSFYRGKNIFITGGTGFVGKFLIFRLLKTCPDLNKIFILIRSKRGKSCYDRYHEFISGEIFSFLGNSRNELMVKVVPIEGDVSEPMLGLSDTDLARILDETNVTFHCAACIRFNEPIKFATKLHVEGSGYVSKMCTKMTELQSLVHVSSISTFYDQDKCEDTVREPPMCPKSFVKLMNVLNDKEATDLTPTLIGKYPNTYTYTKTLAECLVKETTINGDFGVAIARPPFIFPALSSPQPGWFDVPQTLPSLATLHSSGVLRCIGFQDDVRAEYIPVDILTNGLICMGWFMSKDRIIKMKESDQPHDSDTPITSIIETEDIQVDKEEKSHLMTFNFSTEENSLSLFQFSEITTALGQKFPSIRTIRPPKRFIYHRPESMVYKVRKFVSHTMFALFFDFLLILMGQKPVLTKITRKINESLSVAVDQFYKQQLNIEQKNLSHLREQIPEHERDTFFCDIRDVDWDQLLKSHHLRFRRHILKEPDSNIPQAKRRLKMMHRIYTLFNVILMFGTGFLVHFIASSLFSLIS